MNYDSNKLLPAYKRFYKTPVKGKRTVISIALDQSKISSESNVNITFPKLSENVQPRFHLRLGFVRKHQRQILV